MSENIFDFSDFENLKSKNDKPPEKSRSAKEERKRLTQHNLSRLFEEYGINNNDSKGPEESSSIKLPKIKEKNQSFTRNISRATLPNVKYRTGTSAPRKANVISKSSSHSDFLLRLTAPRIVPRFKLQNNDMKSKKKKGSKLIKIRSEVELLKNSVFTNEKRTENEKNRNRESNTSLPDIKQINTGIEKPNYLKKGHANRNSFIGKTNHISKNHVSKRSVKKNTQTNRDTQGRGRTMGMFQRSPSSVIKLNMQKSISMESVYNKRSSKKFDSSTTFKLKRENSEIDDIPLSIDPKISENKVDESHQSSKPHKLELSKSMEFFLSTHQKKLTESRYIRERKVELNWEKTLQYKQRNLITSDSIFVNLYSEIDNFAISRCSEAKVDLDELVKSFVECEYITSQLTLVRCIFRWVCEYIRVAAPAKSVVHRHHLALDIDIDGSDKESVGSTDSEVQIDEEAIASVGHDEIGVGQDDVDKTYILISNTLKKRRAHSLGFSILFQNICHLAGLECIRIMGFIRRKNYEYSDDLEDPFPVHHWNSVLIDKHWRLFDPFLSCGFWNGRFLKDFNDSYFNINPKSFLFDHYPLKAFGGVHTDYEVLKAFEDPQLLQFVPSPISFDKFNIAIKPFRSFFMFQIVPLSHFSCSFSQHTPFLVMEFTTPVGVNLSVLLSAPGVSETLLKSCWYSQSVIYDFNNSNNSQKSAKATIRVVFPFKESYKVLIFANRINQQMLLFHKVLEYEIKVSSGLYDIPTNRKYYAGFLKPVLVHGKEKIISSEIMILEPLQGHFSLDDTLHFRILAPNAVVGIIIANNGKWVRLERNRAPLFHGNSKSIFSGDITMKEFPELSVYYKNESTPRWFLHSTFLYLSKDEDEELPNEKKSGNDELDILLNPELFESSLFYNETKESKLWSGKITLDTWGRCFDSNLQVIQSSIGAKSCSLVISHPYNIIIRCHLKSGIGVGDHLPQKYIKMVEVDDDNPFSEENKTDNKFLRLFCNVPECGKYTIFLYVSRTGGNGIFRFALSFFFILEDSKNI